MPQSVVAVNGVVVVANANKLYSLGEQETEVDIAPSSVPQTETLNFIDHLQASPNKTFVVGINHFDKTVVAYNYKTLEVLAKKCFAKRPSSIAFVDDQTILVADKFGDLYRTDLFKEDDAEERKPVLGHVSMLLSVVVAGDKIITADRDEHIRISDLQRPYIIDAFLFGHTNYVWCLCLVENWLLSGGGDSWISLWSLDKNEEVTRFDLHKAIELDEYNVSHIEKYQDDVLVVIEGTSKIIRISVPDMNLVETYDLPDKIVDLAVDGASVYIAFPNSVGVTDFKQTKILKEFPESSVQILQQHKTRKRGEH